MHPDTTALLVRDHDARLLREADAERLARLARRARTQSETLDADPVTTDRSKARPQATSAW